VKRIILLPTLVTLANAFCGVLALSKAIDALADPAADPGIFYRKLEVACMLVFIGMVFDTLDGWVARVTRGFSAFGAQLDSFADALQLVVMVAIGIFTFNFLLVAAAVLRAWRRVVHLRRALDAIAPADPIEPGEVEYAFRKIMAKEPPHRLPVLARRMLRRLSTGEVIKPAWSQLAFPPLWHYDVLRALDYLREAGVRPDERIQEAVGVVAERRGSDGRWLLDVRHRDTLYPDVAGDVGAPNRWVTLRARRVMDWHRGASA
jgi:hypothetical protein